MAKSDTETSGSEIKIPSDDESNHKILDDHSCEPDDKVERSRQTTKEMICKRSGRKRRSVKDKQLEAEGNYLDDDTDNPLNKLEIRSAAQWRSISQRISLSVDREQANNRVGRSRKSGKVSLLSHFTYHFRKSKIIHVKRPDKKGLKKQSKAHDYRVRFVSSVAKWPLTPSYNYQRKPCDVAAAAPDRLPQLAAG